MRLFEKEENMDLLPCNLSVILEWKTLILKSGIYSLKHKLNVYQEKKVNFSGQVFFF
jgi:hypothetical protein